MGRPVKWRRVNRMPTTLQFLPSDREGNTAIDTHPEENILLLEEYEAIRLKDLEGLEQEECAEQMQISRPTFQRILTTAHQKVADSLIHGKGIRIAGGNATRGVCPVRCLDCGHVWEDKVETLSMDRMSYSCPLCHSNRIVCAPFGGLGNGAGSQYRFCQRNCWRRGVNQQINLSESERDQDADHQDSD